MVTAGEIEMRKGALIDYTIRWMGLPMKWRTLITEYRAASLLRGRTITGSLQTMEASLISFKEVSGGTQLSQTASNTNCPWEFLGVWRTLVFVGRQLRGIFAYRQRAIAKILGVPGIRFTDPVIRTLATL